MCVLGGRGWGSGDGGHKERRVKKVESSDSLV